MKSYQQATISSLSKTSKHVTNVLKGIEKEERKRQVFKDVKQIKNALRNLQDDANQQFQLELESQHTFEFLAEQFRVVRNALLQLTDVVEEEITLSRYTQQSEYNSQALQISQMDSRIKQLQEENMELRRELIEYKSENEPKFIKWDHMSNDYVPKLESALRKVTEVVKQQQSTLATHESELTNHAADLHSINNSEQQDMNRIESDINEIRQFQESATKEIERQIETNQESIKQFAKKISSDIGTLCQEMAFLKQQSQSSVDHTKQKSKLSQLEQEIAKLYAQQETSNSHVEEMTFGLKRIQMNCESLRERYEFVVKELRSETKSTQAAINETNTKIHQVKQQTDRVVSDLSDLERNVTKKTLGLSNAINVLVEMMENMKHREYHDINQQQLTQASMTHTVYQAQ